MENKSCRLCNADLFPEALIELGDMPKAAQFFPKEEEFASDKGIELNIYQCSKCGLVQHILDPVDYYKEVITAATLSEKARNSRLGQMKELAEKFDLKGKKLLDVGCGRGEMLDVIEEAGMSATGIEASPSFVKEGKAVGRNMINAYLGEDDKIDGYPFDAFISLNYLEHQPFPGEIIRNIWNNTTPGAVGFVTVPNFDYLVKTRSLYEFVADHLSYFNEKSLTNAFELNGFDVLKSEIINNENDVAITVRKKQKLDLSDGYAEVQKLVDDFKQMLSKYKSENKKIALWGAGHRTLALLSLADAKEIDYIVDSAKFKQGCYSPILHTPIVAPDHLKEDNVGLVIVAVPGIYPDEVVRIVKEMNLDADIVSLRDNAIKAE